MYAKVFRSLWDGTLGENWEVWSVFVVLLAHADREGYVEMTPGAISRRGSIPLDAVERALKLLQEPDPRSRSSEREGRRLEPIDGRGWGWRIVNYLKYRGMRDEGERREQNRRAQAKYRETNDASAGVSHDKPPSSHAEADAEAKNLNTSPVGTGGARRPRREKRREPPGFPEFYRAYPRRIGRRAAAQEYKLALERNPDFTAEDLAWAAGRFAAQVAKEGTEERYILYPERWLKKENFRVYFHEDEEVGAT